MNDLLEQSTTTLLVIGAGGPALVLVVLAVVLRVRSRRAVEGAPTLAERLVPSRRRARAAELARREREVSEGVAAGLAFVNRESELRESVRAAAETGIPSQRLSQVEESTPANETADA